MRRILIAVTILVLPSLVALIAYLLANRKVPTNRQAVGYVQTIAGDGRAQLLDGKSTSASFSDPFGIVVDRKGNVYVADGGEANCIRRIDSNGKVETVAGSSEGFADGSGPGAQFNTPSGLAINSDGEIIIADTSNNRIRKIDTGGRVSTIGGSGEAGYRDGPAGDAQFDAPIGVAADADGNIFVADTCNDRIRRISSENEISTVAGSGTTGFADGDASSSAFNTPSGITLDENGNIFVADTGNSAIRKITPQGQVTTIARRHQPDQGGPLRALLQPVGIAVTRDGFLFVSCEDGIWRISPEGEVERYAGGKFGYADGWGAKARFNSPSGLALDRAGVLFVADSRNYLVRAVLPRLAAQPDTAGETAELFVQPGEPPSEAVAELIPRIDVAQLGGAGGFPWPLAPQYQWHEVTGVMGEARGAPGNIALDHLHSGLDIRGPAGAPVLAVRDEKVSSPNSSWDFGGSNEGISVGLMSYIHLRVGRDSNDVLQPSDKFKAITDPAGKLIGVRVRRGARFRIGDFVGTVNRLFHVHLNIGPWNGESNPIDLALPGFRDSIAPTIEKDGIEIANSRGRLTERRGGRLVVSGDVRISVSAFDRLDGNGASRKLGLYRLGYQILKEDGSPAPGFSSPMINIEFRRLPPDDPSVLMVYAEGSGVSAYGMPTKFKYIVTNLVRDGRAIAGVLRTSSLGPGNYVIRVIVEDRAGNRASGPETELPITVEDEH